MQANRWIIFKIVQNEISLERQGLAGILKDNDKKKIKKRLWIKWFKMWLKLVDY